jgi:hypothetical protein
MSLISSLNSGNFPKSDYNHLKKSNGFVEYSNVFDFYKTSIPDGSEPSFVDFSEFLAFLNYFQILYPSPLKPLSLSFSICHVLRRCSYYPVIFLNDYRAASYV